MYYWHWLKNIVRRPQTTGFPTEPDDRVQAMSDRDALKVNGHDAERIMRRAVAIRHVDAGSCNGCESELGLLSSPDYDLSRYGFSFTPSPKHADILVVTGVITETMVSVITAVFEQMTAPKRVVALGACAIDGGVFRAAPAVRGGLDGVVPVTALIAGCPPSPGDILRGLLACVDGSTPAVGEGAYR